MQEAPTLSVNMSLRNCGAVTSAGMAVIAIAITSLQGQRFVTSYQRT